MTAADAGPLSHQRGPASIGGRGAEPDFEPRNDGRRRVLIATDAWYPQVNGVVRTLSHVRDILQRWNYDVRFIAPTAFSTVAMPGYPEIRLALFAGRLASQFVGQFKPHSIHIATEGPIGLTVWRHCLERGWPFTTSFHTMFPEYIQARTSIPAGWIYPLLKRFHNRARAVMVATPSLERDLEKRGFMRLRRWSRGVDVDLFRPGVKEYLTLPRPIFLYVGRIAVEKNLEAFLRLALPGTKLVVGDGPQLLELKAKYPEVHFAGARFGEDLARHYAASDVFVFPSRTDTFGLVLLEALSSGLPIAAYPVQGPIDVVGNQSDVGALDEDLAKACIQALSVNPKKCREHALAFSWEACAKQFLSNLSWKTN